MPVEEKELPVGPELPAITYTSTTKLKPPTVVFLKSEYCHHCTKIADIVRDAAYAAGVPVVVIETSTDPKVPPMSVPRLRLYVNGKQVGEDYVGRPSDLPGETPHAYRQRAGELYRAKLTNVKHGMWEGTSIPPSS